MDFRPTETQIYKHTVRLRSRHMIPMEMLAFLTLLLAGIAGAFPIGYLHSQIAGADKVGEWAFALIPLALTGYAVAAAEWWLGAAWENGHLRMSIAARAYLSLGAMCLWGYIVYVMLGLENGPITSMMISAFFVGPFHFWSFWVNLRVLTALNPKLKTERLRQRLEAGRDRF